MVSRHQFHFTPQNRSVQNRWVGGVVLAFGWRGNLLANQCGIDIL